MRVDDRLNDQKISSSCCFATFYERIMGISDPFCCVEAILPITVHRSQILISERMSG